MKKVVKKVTPEMEVAIDQVSSVKYYGVLAYSSRNRGFITRFPYWSGSFVALCSSKVTSGNNWDSYTSNTLSEFISTLLRNGFFTIYEFDTARELFAWVAESE